MDSQDVKDIRAAEGLTQQQFADKYGLKVRTLRSWEQGERNLSSTSEAFMLLVKRR